MIIQVIQCTILAAEKRFYYFFVAKAIYGEGALLFSALANTSLQEVNGYIEL